MAYWSIMCWDDVGGPEDGIIPHHWREVFEANTQEEALADAKRRGFTVCFKYEGEEIGYSRGIPDITPATEDEIAYHKYLQEQEEEFIRLYGCNPYDYQ